ncbi:hypothetical protein K435DRAFT_829103 [Dendrothele bispora CBS 962.96]|uniref:RPA43 OB domain-containing protein n=1 Tax=Dendrothele bispora (strain CBS 962.96) TaxID=1314807 RepID=A0A4S8M006_DENBC|nr:hypothetical protein K435DRAFT_829103 [Dendrothele bispora CBS 962.96]
MTPSTSNSKKRKFQDSLKDAPTKKQKKEAAKLNVESKDKKGKGKDTEFQVICSSMVISISPVFANHPRSGVEEMLDSMIMRYIPALEGVVLSHDNLIFLDKKASITADCPFLVCRIKFDATVWRPHVGMKLVGKINLCSPDHISLLVHKTFNVSIPRHHIPVDQWEFEYGAAENDPEYGAAAQQESDHKTDEEGIGRWIHKLTAEPLGGSSSYLEFTVIGLTVANEMLSLLGSIQSDPFSPLHVPATAIRSKSDEVSDADNKIVADELLANLSVEDGDDEGNDSDSDQDGFQTLGKKAEQASAEAARRKVDKTKRIAEEKKKRQKRKPEESVDSEKTGKKRKSSKR